MFVRAEQQKKVKKPATRQAAARPRARPTFAAAPTVSATSLLPAPMTRPIPVAHMSLTQKLSEAKDMHASGLLSAQEFLTIKQNIMQQLMC